MDTQEEKTKNSRGVVLMVDDDKFLIDMYAMKFTQEGFEVHSFLAACDALDALRGGLVPDVILFDLVMPECDGFSFLEILNKEKLAPKAFKIALTNQSSESEMVRTRELGADDFLIKATLLPSEVVNTVTRALQEHSKLQ